MGGWPQKKQNKKSQPLSMKELFCQAGRSIEPRLSEYNVGTHPIELSGEEFHCFYIEISVFPVLIHVISFKWAS